MAEVLRGKVMPCIIGAWHHFRHAKDMFFLTPKEGKDAACTALGFAKFWRCVAAMGKFLVYLWSYAASIVLFSSTSGGDASGDVESAIRHSSTR